MSQLVARLVQAMIDIDIDIDTASADALAAQPLMHQGPDLGVIDDTLRRLLARIAELEAGLTRARDEALQASRLKSEFLAVMCNELRTPQNAVLGMAQLLELTKLDELQSRHVGHVRQGGVLLLAGWVTTCSTWPPSKPVAFAWKRRPLRWRRCGVRSLLYTRAWPRPKA